VPQETDQDGMAKLTGLSVRVESVIPRRLKGSIRLYLERRDRFLVACMALYAVRLLYPTRQRDRTMRPVGHLSEASPISRLHVASLLFLLTVSRSELN
jgi:hypothetical protein